MPFALSGDGRRVGAALLMIPLELQRSPPHTSVVVPAALLPFRVAPGPKGGPSLAYDNRRNTWLGPLTRGTNILLRFQVPMELLPVRFQRAVLTVTVRAPSRNLDLLGSTAEGLVAWERRHSPLGPLRFEIVRPEGLLVDAEGGLLFGLKIGDIEGVQSNEASRIGWKIDDVQLELRGETLP